MFRVGQKVVCVNDGVMGLRGAPALVRGQIYEITHMYHSYTGNHLVLNLAGVEIAWDARRFRPVTDIGFAHEILRKVTKRDTISSDE
jgi:hypothetical protein